MYGGSKQDGISQNGYSADSRQGGMQACKLIVACNKADLLPKQASLARIQVSCFSFMPKQVSAHEMERRHKAKMQVQVSCEGSNATLLMELSYAHHACMQETDVLHQNLFLLEDP